MAGVGEGTKSSMLQEILYNLRMQNRKQVLHSVVCVSRLSAGIADKRDIGFHYDKLFKACQQRHQGDGPTGLLLVYPQHCLHLVEAPWEVLVDLISDLCTMHSSGGLLVDTRILQFSTNNAQRFYPQWAWRVLNLPALPKGESYQTNDPIEQTVGSSLESLYKLGVHLSQLTPHQVKQTMDKLTEMASKFLLQQDVLEYYLGCQELNSPREFIESYCSPTQLVLDSELVWPLPVRLFPYDD